MSEKLLQAAIKLREAQRDYLSDPERSRSELKGQKVATAAAQLDLVIAEIQFRQKANKLYNQVSKATEILIKVDHIDMTPAFIKQITDILGLAMVDFEKDFPNE